ncbi:MAG TPA: alpha-N-acetylglucosaminidase TIM-barrel domain-containing protein [Bacteroidota bacterium]|nr:alpha-N-acetylglucosaminidase TIM-barrel domain-containing protein [Bacteroidota bacterium]
MRSFILVLVALLILASSEDALSQSGMSLPALAQARWLIKRTVKERSVSFTLRIISKDRGRDVFEVEASGGKVSIAGSGTLAIARGFYHYLRHACDAQVSWSGVNLNLPKKFPDFPMTRIVSPYTFRQFYNVCTFGYTTAWWDWKRWEREIDWMALHGISMPLAMTGQEVVWRSLWRSMGISAGELDDYFTGPAFLPWHRMGNINKHGGPLPQGWIDAQAVLQKKILERMRSLGMTPVVPAFSGFVPDAFRRIHPEVHVYDIAPWDGFSKDCGTHILSPTSPLFKEIGRRFITEYVKMFGTDHYYLADSFNELQVPVSDTARYKELSEFGEAVYSSIAAGDPKGTWVMQGWLFFNDRSFWDKPSTRALLSKVPNDRMIILDLANELFHGWREQDAFYGKQWIYSIIHNFGGNNPLAGNLAFTAEDPARALESPARGKLVGIGLAPEGIENNDVLYELSTDMFWSDGPVQLESWLDQYAVSRYGILKPEISKAWRLLAQSAYSKSAGNLRHGFQSRPARTVQGDVDVSPAFTEAVRQFLQVADAYAASALYKADAIELASQYLGGIADERLREALRANDSGMPELRDTLFAEALNLMNGIDALLNCRPDRRLEPWIASACRWGRSGADSAFYEGNARLQITLWGGPSLFDYASKMWSGLIRDFYAGRWKFYFDQLRKLPPGGVVPEEKMVAWEKSWTELRSLSAPTPIVDPVSTARTMIESAQHSVVVTAEPMILPDVQVFDKAESLRVEIQAPSAGAVIRYTLDGSLPDRKSLTYQGPFLLGRDATVSARAFGPSGYPSFVVTRSYAAVKKGENGLNYRYFEGDWGLLPDFDTVRAVRSGIAYRVSLADIPTKEEFFGIQYNGFLEISVSGQYTFSLGSDDGSQLWIDGELLVNNDGQHGYAELKGSVKLSKGRHAFLLKYFQSGGAKSLALRCSGPNFSDRPIPPARFFISE